MVAPGGRKPGVVAGVRALALTPGNNRMVAPGTARGLSSRDANSLQLAPHRLHLPEVLAFGRLNGLPGATILLLPGVRANARTPATTPGLRSMQYT